MNICKVNGLECCECQPVCGSRKEPVNVTEKHLFEQLLVKVGCKFYDSEKSIEIHEDNMVSYGGVSIEFDKNGKFRGFMKCD